MSENLGLPLAPRNASNEWSSACYSYFWSSLSYAIARKKAPTTLLEQNSRPHSTFLKGGELSMAKNPIVDKILGIGKLPLLLGGAVVAAGGIIAGLVWKKKQPTGIKKVMSKLPKIGK